MVIFDHRDIRFLVFILKLIFRFLRLFFLFFLLLAFLILIFLVLLLEFLFLLRLLLQLIDPLPLPNLVILKYVFPHLIILRVDKLLKYLLLVLMFLLQLGQHTLDIFDLVLQGLRIVDIPLQLLAEGVELLHQIVVVRLHVSEDDELLGVG